MQPFGAHAVATDEQKIGNDYVVVWQFIQSFTEKFLEGAYKILPIVTEAKADKSTVDQPTTGLCSQGRIKVVSQRIYPDSSENARLKITYFIISWLPIYDGADITAKLSNNVRPPHYITGQNTVILLQGQRFNKTHCHKKCASIIGKSSQILSKSHKILPSAFHFFDTLISKLFVK